MYRVCVCGGGTLWLSLAVSDWEHRGAFCRIVKWCDSVWPRLPATVVLDETVDAYPYCLLPGHCGKQMCIMFLEWMIKYFLQEEMSGK